MKIYLDTCCYNRPYDDQSQTRIRAEAAAVDNIVVLARLYRYTVFGSDALDEEIGDIKVQAKHEQVLGLYRRTVTNQASPKKAVFDHFMPIAARAGIGRVDTLHLCYSISAGADYLLTTDDDFIKLAARLALPVLVINPLNFPFGGAV